MKRENLEKATKINQEIQRLEQEIEFLDDANMRRTHSIVKALKPKKYTYKGYFVQKETLIVLIHVYIWIIKNVWLLQILNEMKLKNCRSNMNYWILNKRE